MRLDGYNTPQVLDRTCGPGSMAITITRSPAVGFFSMGIRSRLYVSIPKNLVSRRSNCANERSFSSARCLYFSEHRAAATYALIHSTARSTIPIDLQDGHFEHLPL
ncbi:hypothetical protein TNCV_3395201 [Trichonephila clavipes]|nr:hypothetical protein TNCV_3395201 [Trichonephila clavipes]